MRKVGTGAMLLSAAVMIASTGCATLMSGTTQKISVNSTPPGAHVQFGNVSGTTPVTLNIPKGKNFPLEISHKSDKRLVTLNRTVDPATFLNLIPPLWPGFIVDMVTGAMTQYDAEVISLDFDTNQFHLTSFND